MSRKKQPLPTCFCRNALRQRNLSTSLGTLARPDPAAAEPLRLEVQSEIETEITALPHAWTATNAQSARRWKNLGF
jgi:hypothetical protein